MVKFIAQILKFHKKAEKTGWTYIGIPVEIAEKINPGCKKSFRTKGKLDNYTFRQVALMPMGDGDFIMQLNGEIRKTIKKKYGDKLAVQIELDSSPVLLSKDLTECLKDEPKALSYFNSLPRSHQNYFSKWIESAKTDPTKTKRITMAVNALAKRKHFGEMMREQKENSIRVH